MALLLGMLLLYNMAMAACQEVLVYRNARDIFRVGKNGCTSDRSICTTRSATCQTDGSCLCHEDSPNFRNPVIERFDKYGETYGCVKSEYILDRVGAHPCELKPFQLVPYSHNDPPTKFTVDMDGVEMLLSCSLLNGTTRNKKARPQVKYPRYSKEVELNWMEKSYINFTVSKKDFFFKWAKAVKGLQGTIITLKFSCKISEELHQQICLVAKVLGSRSIAASMNKQSHSVGTQPSNIPNTPEVSTDSIKTTTPITFEVRSGSTTVGTSSTTSDHRLRGTVTKSPRSSAESSLPAEDSIESDHSTFVTPEPSTKPVTYDFSLNNKITSPRLLARSGPSRELQDSDGDFNWTLIVVAVFVAVVIVMVLVFLVVFLFKRRKKKNQTNSRRGSVEARSGSTSVKEIRNSDDDAQGLDPNEEPGYETANFKKGNVDGRSSDTTYSRPDKKRSTGNSKSGKSLGPDSYEEPGYEMPDATKKEIESSSSNTTYAKPNKKRSADNIKSKGGINPDSCEKPGYKTFDVTKKEIDGSSSDTTYAKPDKKRKEVERQDHSASDHGIKTNGKNADHSTPDIKRIEINGDLYALPDKNKNTEKSDGLDKEENPPELVSGSGNGNERQDQSSKLTAEPKMEK